MYCKTDLVPETVFDVCKTCGHGVWGEKKYDAIITNMRKARDKGDLYQGSVTDPLEKEKYETVTQTQDHSQTTKKSPLASMTQEALETEKELIEAESLITEATQSESDLSQEELQKVTEQLQPSAPVLLTSDQDSHLQD